MRRNALFLILIAGLFLAVIVMAQTPSSTLESNTSVVPETGGNATTPSENQTLVNSTSGDYVQGELLVKFNPDAFPNMNALTALSMQAHAAIGAVIIPDFEGTPGWEHIKLPSSMTVEHGIEYYKTIPTVMYVEVNAIYSIANASTQGNQTINPPPAGNTTEKGDVFVQYNTTAFASSADLQGYANTTNTAINASVITDYSQYGMPGLQLVKLDSNMTSSQGVEYYKNIPYVNYAEPNVQYKAVTVNQTTNGTPGQSG